MSVKQDHFNNPLKFGFQQRKQIEYIQNMTIFPYCSESELPW